MKKSNAKQTVDTPSKEEIAIQKLRSQKEKHEKALRESGAQAGRDYVLAVEENDGVYQQLVALARQEERVSGSVTDLSALMEVLNCDAQDWLDHHGSEAKEEAWVSGFAEGALETFRRLQSKL